MTLSGSGTSRTIRSICRGSARRGTKKPLAPASENALPRSIAASTSAESSVSKLLGVRNRQDASELVVDLLGDRVVLGGGDAQRAVHEALLTRCLSIAGGTTQILRAVSAVRRVTVRLPHRVLHALIEEFDEAVKAAERRSKELGA